VLMQAWSPLRQVMLCIFFVTFPLTFFLPLYTHFTLIASWPLGRVVSSQVSFFLTELISSYWSNWSTFFISQLPQNSMAHNPLESYIILQDYKWLHHMSLMSLVFLTFSLVFSSFPWDVTDGGIEWGGVTSWIVVSWSSPSSSRYGIKS